MSDVHNFSAGPAALPKFVLKRAQQELLDFNNTHLSIMEMSHRSETYERVHNQAIQRLKSTLKLDESTHVLFLQGGASLQFSMLPMNFLKQQANYVLSGSWSEKAEAEARKLGQTIIGASSKDQQYRDIPSLESITYNEQDSYLHITSNNTIFGTQWKKIPKTTIPLVCDMSSDMLSRELDYNAFDFFYAGAQKNLGPAGVTVAVIKDAFLKQANPDVPTMLSYQTFAQSNSLYNTPPVFPIYMLGLVLEWIEDEGGLSVIEANNTAKAALIYEAIDASAGFYLGYASKQSRSHMNITFNLQHTELETTFLAEAEEKGLIGLAGHRSVGGCRASIYNAVPYESCEVLAAFMNSFCKRHT